jgi:MFS family permease
MSQLIPLTSLLLGAAFLFIAGGIHGLILPVRGSLEGFSDLSLGLIGTGWAIGYVLGCISVPRMVARVGHIRPFGVMATAASLSVLLSSLLVHPWAWISLRALAGFAFAGAAMIIESWISEKTNPGSRGKVYGVYTMVNLGSLTAGQLALSLGSPSGFFFFVLAAIFYNLALIPTAISSSATPKPLTRSRLDIGLLWRNSPVAVVAVFLVGIANSSFNTLGAVFGQQRGLDITAISIFMSVPIICGALAQIPTGILSDRVDRRFVLIGGATVAVAAELVFIVVDSANPVFAIATGALFGAAIYSLYPVIIAHANDHAEPGDYVRTSGGLLLLFGTGSIFGPLFSGYVMSRIGPSGLFLTALGAHMLLIAFTLFRIRRRKPVAGEGKSPFVVSASDGTLTPEAAALKAEVTKEREEQ